MAEIIRMPKMSDTMEEGVIASWLKKVGEEVKSGDILAEVETDKATMELESYDDGFLLHIGVNDGDSVPVDGLIAIIGEKDEDISSILDEIKSDKIEGNKKVIEEPESTPIEIKEKNIPIEDVKEETNLVKEIKEDIISENDTRVKASPLAKKLAIEKGINISEVSGSGDCGRITKKDTENFSPISSNDTKSEIILPKIHSKESYEEIPVSQMRKTISKRLAESKFSAPHFYLTMEIDMQNCIEGRKKINESS